MVAVLTELIIIIPDMHNDYKKAEKIIKKEKPGKIIFLGDYFDNYYDSAKDATKTAKWLVKSLEEKNRIHLIGNHDLSYMTDNPNLKCTGYDEEKHAVIRKQFIPWNELKMYHWIDDWLCTHAGLSDDFLKQQKRKTFDSVTDVLDYSKEDLKNIHDSEQVHPFFQVGSFRGGSNTVGGPLWCDYGEFVDIPKIKQIFGHTKGDAIRHKKTKNAEHYCIDTGLHHYAAYQTGNMEIKEILFS